MFQMIFIQSFDIRLPCLLFSVHLTVNPFTFPRINVMRMEKAHSTCNYMSLQGLRLQGTGCKLQVQRVMIIIVAYVTDKGSHFQVPSSSKCAATDTVTLGGMSV